MSRLSRILLILSLVVAIAFLYRPLFLTALVAAGRSPHCTLLEALRSYDEGRRQVQIKDWIVQRSRLVERDDAGYALWETPRGRFWIPAASSGALFWDLAEQERKIYGTGAKAGDTVLDCGANVGVYTSEALRAGARLVVAIEPAPENIQCLRRNFESEIAAGRVVVYPKGVWDKDDLLALNVDPNNSAADSFLIEPEGSRAVPRISVTTIDRLAKELNLERVDLIKMDIEGAEQRALFGAQGILMRDHPRLALSVYHSPEDPQKIPIIVRAAWPGYRMDCGPCSLAENRILPNVYYFR